jgi:hypothetical protein
VSGFTSQFHFVGSASDTWQWWPDPAKGYSLCDAYQLLSLPELAPLDVVDNLIWHK